MRSTAFFFVPFGLLLAACGSGGDSGVPTPGTTSGGPVTTSSECPLFDGTPCEGFLDGCWAPDLTGTCSDNNIQLDWSDGHKSLYPFKQIAALAEKFQEVN